MDGSISVGKARGLQSVSGEHGGFNILALDHRQNLRKLLRPTDPAAATFASMRDFKRAVLAGAASATSAVLLDPEAGLPAALAPRVLPGHVGMILAVEETGYAGPDHDRRSRLVKGWSVEKARRVGADGVKLLVYYHPGATAAVVQEGLVAEVAEACRRWDIPLFVEALMFSTTPGHARIEAEQRTETSVELARRLSALGADVLKLEFPVDPELPADEHAWEAACGQVSAASQVPWVLLSGAVDFDVFLAQVRVACGAGASGAMSGRAVWKEAIGLGGEHRLRFLSTTARSRLELLGAVVDAAARPWFEVLKPPRELEDGWYQRY